MWCASTDVIFVQLIMSHHYHSSLILVIVVSFWMRTDAPLAGVQSTALSLWTEAAQE